jgi:hypothetical protein
MKSDHRLRHPGDWYQLQLNLLKMHPKKRKRVLSQREQPQPQKIVHRQLSLVKRRKRRHL